MADQKITEIIISGSVGELEWILPVAKELLDSGNRVNISFLKDSARQSFESNTLRIIVNKNFLVAKDVLLSNKDLIRWQFLTRVYRFLSRILNDSFHDSLDKCFATFGSILFPRVHKIFKNNPSSVMVEFPSDSRLLGAILRGNKANIVYFPHSPHMYYQGEFDKSANEFISVHNKLAGDSETYLFGCAEDVSALIKDGWEPAKKSKILIIGHPKYSNDWIEHFKSQTKRNLSEGVIKIGVLSRGVGNFLSQNEHERLVTATYNAITQMPRDFEVRVKLHPREFIGQNTSWGDYLTEGFFITEDHVYKIFAEVDFVIIMFSSAALDAAVWNIPAIEMYDPDVSPALQLKKGGKYHTIYELLGLVEKATCEEELRLKIFQLISGGAFDLKRSEDFELLLDRSNNWLDEVQSEFQKW